jgi:plasmid maintenance system antidote protein VapI
VFRHVLREQLRRRQSRNTRYSLRAFARDLGLHHGTLSQLLRGRRPVTPKQIRVLGARLGLDGAEVLACCQAETDATVRAAIGRRAFRHDSRWIATRTGIPVDEVNAALHRLLRSGALRMLAPADWRAHA